MYTNVRESNAAARSCAKKRIRKTLRNNNHRQFEQQTQAHLRDEHGRKAQGKKAQHREN